MEFYLTVGATLISSLLFFLIGILKKDYYHLPYKWYFIVYVFLSFIQSVFALVIRFKYKYLLESNLIEISINIFTLFEIILFTFFFLKVITDPKIKKIIFTLIVPFLFTILYKWVILNEYSIFNKNITVTECVLFIIICLLYFINVLRTPIEKKLNDNPQVWIVIGIFFLFILLFPFYLLQDEIYEIFIYGYETFFAIINIGYTVLFICLLKSIQCQLNLK